ncbi:hypothetical protein G6F22_020119 [Rhizopus arrhizus]|nr:hypothetical protein G6F22_020119 [Rhizopus arrhizus]
MRGDFTRRDEADAQIAQDGLPDRLPAADLQGAPHGDAGCRQGVLGQLARHGAGFAQQHRMVSQIGQPDAGQARQRVVAVRHHADRVGGDHPPVQVLVIHQKR